MVSAPGAWRYKISPPSFRAKRAQFWLHFGVRGGHWLDEGRLLVQERYGRDGRDGRGGRGRTWTDVDGRGLMWTDGTDVDGRDGRTGRTFFFTDGRE